MLLDHTTAFTDYQPVDLLLDLRLHDAEDQAAARSRPQQGGVLPGTLIETECGFKQARALRPGDMVQTFDGGQREVVTIRHSVPRLTAMVHVPVGALGNDAALELPSDAVVAVSGDLALDLFDLPVVTVKLVALIGHNGISTALPQRLARIHIGCAEEELLWTEGGLVLNAGEPEDDGFYSLLSFTEARQIVAAGREDHSACEIAVEVTSDEDGDDAAFLGLDAAPLPAFDPIDLLFGRYAA
ncbi:Hint domain-containing protein [Tritonibacter scottomollicae]|uniref:Hint domain-containing protein n=1 Tax=Tritonibacter scottomollicae TaxID=483013 RepID=A0ABZ0HJG9_TRISK|nr:Hint domain-containing protein [Tritonibacter scottomollicae]WOI33692.1 Hint domain-containing protein [Tritonibacter scottomollicae]